MAGVLAVMGLLQRSEDEVTAQEEAEAALLEEQEAAEAEAAASGRAAEAAAAAPAPQHAQRERGEAVPEGRSAAELAQAAALRDMSQVDMRAARQARPKAIKPEQLRPRHTARPELTAAAAAPPPPPVAMPPPVPEAAAGEDFDANVAFAMQASYVAPGSRLSTWPHLDSSMPFMLMFTLRRMLSSSGRQSLAFVPLVFLFPSTFHLAPITSA